MTKFSKEKGRENSDDARLDSQLIAGAGELGGQSSDEVTRSQDHLRLVIDTIPILVWRADPDGVPEFLNQTALDYAGLSLDQAELDWPRAFHPEDKKDVYVKWSAIRDSGKPGSLEARLRRFDGVYRWFLLQAQPLRDHSGGIINRRAPLTRKRAVSFLPAHHNLA